MFISLPWGAEDAPAGPKLYFCVDVQYLIQFCQLLTIREASLSTSYLLWSVFFSSLGLGFFVYGRKQKAIVPLICGLVLMAYPYFVSDIIPLVSIGSALAAIPYFVRI